MMTSSFGAGAGRLTDAQKSFLRAAGVSTDTGVIESRELFDKATEIVGSGNPFIERGSGGERLTATGISVVAMAVTPPSDPVVVTPVEVAIPLPVVDPESLVEEVEESFLEGLMEFGAVAGAGGGLAAGGAALEFFEGGPGAVQDVFESFTSGLLRNTGEVPMFGAVMGNEGNLSNLMNFVHTKQRRR